MADSMVRVDLSEQAADFRRLALQPGMGLIDRSGAHYAILRKWLGSHLSEPVWDGQFVTYAIRAEEDANFSPKAFQPLTAAECRGAFRGEIEALVQKLEAAPARTGTERALRHVMQDRLKKLQADPNYAAQSGALAKYLDPSGVWRLAWLWGFERKTSEPGTVAICKKPNCRTLGVITDERRTCPACGGKLKTATSPLPLVAAVLLLLLAGGGIGYWLTHPPAPAALGSAMIQGQVVSAVGQKPLANASILLEGTETKVRTDAEGRFELKSLSPTAHTLRIQAEGFHEETALADLSKDTDFLKVALKGVGAVEGHVRDEINRAPIKNASISLPSWGITVHTDDDGNFALENLPGGKVQIEASAAGFESKRAEGTLAAGEALSLEFQLAGQGKLVGTVMDALTLNPVPQATVFLLNTPLTATTDPMGRFEITGIPTGQATIAVQAVGYQAEHADQDLKGTETRPFLVGLHGAAEVRGRVKSEAHGMPLAGASVEISHPKYQKTVTTNARGEFEFQKLPPGEKELRITLAGYRDGKAQTQAEENAKPLEIALSGDAVLSGTVIDAIEKNPLASVEVRIAGSELVAKTGEDGKFKLQGIPGGKATVQIVGRGYRQEDLQETFETGKERNISVELKGGTILSGRVLDALTKEPIREADVTLAGTSQKTVTDSEGRFRFEDLVAGAKTLNISAQGYRAAEEATELKTEEEAALEIALKGDAVLSGRVVSAQGEKPLAGAKVKIAGRSQETQTDEQGRFRLDDVPSGTRDLEITQNGYQPGGVSRDLASGGETQVDIALRGAAALVGSVVTHAGEPIENARVTIENDLAASTTDTGEFRVDGLVPGESNVTIAAKGFHPEQKRIMFSGTDPASLGEVKLRPVEVDAVGLAKAFDAPAPEGVIGLTGTAPVELSAGIPRDDFRTRLDRANAKTGDVQVSLAWDNINDIDLHVQTPSGEVIYYSNRRSQCGGELDVDMNANGPESNEPIENTYWPLGTAPRGKYKVLAHHYANHGGSNPTDFRVAVKNGEEVKYYTGKVNPLEKVLVCEFERLTGPEPVPIAGTEPPPMTVADASLQPGTSPDPVSESDGESGRKLPPVYHRSDEEQAAQRLKLAEDLLALKKPDAAKRWLEDVVSRYPNTQTCRKCRKLLDQLGSRGASRRASRGTSGGAGGGADLSNPSEGIYLADLTPVRHNVGGELQARTVSIDGEPKHHSLWTRTNLPNPPASAEYALGRRYSSLSGSVGIDDSGQADRTRVSTSFQIIGDGKVLWSSKSLRDPGKSERFEVDVSQVNNLKILTDSNRNPSYYPVWIDPWLAGQGTD